MTLADAVDVFLEIQSACKVFFICYLEKHLVSNVEIIAILKTALNNFKRI